ncbi:hypothetical protein VP01_1132g2 [Puccinia sorghi]|uniref:Uncharacterized protein n=1 Tax=Puccinia sorghi TaxID=27349 RepID=A0A0L6VSC3_9BASI|nr:hypothetical protein VP01_1132g2 [Puccinia sorghi]
MAQFDATLGVVPQLLKFLNNNIPGFITSLKTNLARFHKIGIEIADNIVTYLILDKLPSSMDNVIECITYLEVKITPELAMEQLRVYHNDQKVISNVSGSRSNPISLFSDSSPKCQKDAHNTLAQHSQAKCWMLHPQICPAREPKT